MNNIVTSLRFQFESQMKRCRRYFTVCQCACLCVCVFFAKYQFSACIDHMVRPTRRLPTAAPPLHTHTLSDNISSFAEWQTRERRVPTQFVKAQCKHKGTVHKESSLLKVRESMAKRVEWTQRERVRKIHANLSRQPNGGGCLWQNKRKTEQGLRESTRNLCKCFEAAQQEAAIGLSRR